MSNDKGLSPLLHKSVYLEAALNDAVQFASKHYQADCAIEIEPDGWRLRVCQSALPEQETITLLREVMNKALFVSLERRLEGLSQ